ncbi:MAG: efflux RND transporter periplasmic adaptor subunit [Sphaerochaetaceae bacterium]|nr:efflux RND transporter periplasmic adaptor subunit [Sphaerochaetaceae bacterium]MDC7236289.1 efflux RND transporter periplasmic adaptor subunit [Sphaerochaetaceae bacterium]MDC7250267.1 efflux RND transporter periplasmic adaptor subunit [Sphaerochaetaceae bacterium]
MSSDDKIIQVDKVKPHSSKKKKRRIVIILLLLVALGAGIYWYLNQSVTPDTVSVSSYTTVYVVEGDLTSTTEASGTVVLPNQVTIISTEDAYVDTLYVSEGDSITKEDVLIKFSIPDYEDDMETYTLELEQANIELESQLEQNDYELQTLQLSIDRLEDEIEDTLLDKEKYEALASVKNTYKDSLEDIEDTLESLYESLEDTKNELEYEKTIQSIDINKQKASIKMIELNISQLEEDIEDLNVTSPMAGEILSINEDLYIEGNYIESSDELFIVADRSQVYVDLDIYEQYASLLDVGDPLELTIGTETMNATIVSIGKVASMDSDGLTATITIRVEPETDTTLNPGASAVASIVLGVEENVLQLPRGSYLTTGNQKYVYVVDGDKAYKTEVVFGDIQSNTVQVISGLEAGDEIITSSYQGFISEDVIQLK